MRQPIRLSYLCLEDKDFRLAEVNNLTANHFGVSLLGRPSSSRGAGETLESGQAGAHAHTILKKTLY